MAKRRPRQTQIPGTERETVPELEEIAEPYVQELYTALDAQAAAKDLRAQLLERMRQMKLKNYVHSDGEYDYEFEAESTTKLKTKRRRVGSDDEGVPAVEGEE